MNYNIVNYNTLQDDVVAYLNSDLFLQHVLLFAVKPKNLKSEVNQALSGLKLTNGKAGASIEVGKPYLVAPDEGAPGPTALIEMRFLVKVQPTINNGRAGTGLAAETISAHLIQALLEWGPVGSLSGSFFPAPNFDSPAEFGDDAPFEGRLVLMHAKIVFTPLDRTVCPQIDDPNKDYHIAITVAAPDAAAPILYTTDGSAPAYQQGTTVPDGTTRLYAGPFPVIAGTIIRAMAVAPGKLPSIINQANDS